MCHNACLCKAHGKPRVNLHDMCIWYNGGGGIHKQLGRGKEKKSERKRRRGKERKERGEKRKGGKEKRNGRKKRKGNKKREEK